MGVAMRELGRAGRSEGMGVRDSGFVAGGQGGLVRELG